MDFHSELVKITEFQPLEDYLVRKKASELEKTSKSGKITVSINPSNLVELTRVGERFAPDSCVDNIDIKYILSNKLIPNTFIPTHFERHAKDSHLSSFEDSKSQITPIIPNMIVRQRPGISYQPIRETSYISVQSEPSLIDEEKVSVKSAPTPGSQKQVIRIPSSLNKKPSNSELRKEINVKNEEFHVKPLEKTQKMSAGKKLPAKKSGKTSKTLKKKVKKMKTILKKSNSDDVDESSNSEKKTVTWEEDENNIMKEHEAKRKMHLDKYKYQCPSYLKEKETNAEKLGRLEKIVEEEREVLKDKGIVTPDSSQGSKYKKTYEELEKEIQNIREMLSEDVERQEEVVDEDYEEAEISEYENDEQDSDEREQDVDYCYSSDDCKEDKAWMKPKFK